MEEEVSATAVFATLQGSFSSDNVTRSAAEAQLHKWEVSSAPGFVGSLLNVALEVQGVPEVRSYA
jgi:hypothetical protein